MIDVNVLTSGRTIAGVIASFLVAAIALGLGLSSLIQTQRLQKRERRERLLNEIIEWAESIILFGVGETVREDWAQLSDEQKTDKATAMRRGFGFMDIRDKGKRVLGISAIDTELECKVKSVLGLLQEHIDKWTQAKEGKLGDWKEIAKHKETLDNSVRELIGRATNLLIR